MMDQNRPVIYIAGPYTNPDPVENTHKAVRFANHLLSSGMAYPLVPHLSMLWHTICPRPYEDWLEIDLAHMARCDGVIRLPGQSTGADDEVRIARERGMPVLTVRSNIWVTPSTPAQIADWLREEGLA